MSYSFSFSFLSLFRILAAIAENSPDYWLTVFTRALIKSFAGHCVNWISVELSLIIFSEKEKSLRFVIMLILLFGIGEFFFDNGLIMDNVSSC